MFGIRMIVQHDRLYVYLPYSRKANEDNCWGMIRGTNADGELSEITSWTLEPAERYWHHTWKPVVQV